QVSSASLLLFWTDIWALLCSIYYVSHRIKPFFKSEETKE
ncbi:16933_t:CDS:1, partial [Gigaspora rosea]